MTVTMHVQRNLSSPRSGEQRENERRDQEISNFKFFIFPGRRIDDALKDTRIITKLVLQVNNPYMLIWENVRHRARNVRPDCRTRRQKPERSKNFLLHHFIASKIRTQIRRLKGHFPRRSCTELIRC